MQKQSKENVKEGKGEAGTRRKQILAIPTVYHGGYKARPRGMKVNASPKTVT